jgi:Bacterial TSP3 repeat
MRRPATLLLASLAALALPAGAQASRFTPLHPGTPGVVEAGSAFAAKAAPLPVVTSISPKHVGIGHVLTVHGRHFVAGKGKNTIVFQSSGHRFVFVKAGRSTPHIIKLTVPKKLASFLTLKKGVSQATRFKIRVLARRFGAAFTSSTRSPLVLPSGNGTATPAECGSTSSPNGDADKDGLTNALEKKIHTDPCLPDTDGDGMSDFWEYHSALDYNSSASWRDAVMYPGKRPYPNALDPSDKGIDFDGDGLTNTDEYQIWAKCGNKKSPNLFMSDGTQTSHPLGSAQPVKYSQIPNGAAHLGLDLNQDGEITDDERDSDLCDPKGIHGDGLGNWVEAHGPMQPSWWKAIVPDEKAYGLSRFAGTDFLDPDTDGDGILDGADDVDHDGYSNADEINRYILQPGEQAKYSLVSSDPLWVQPFNPCLPDPGPTFRNPRPPLSYDDQTGGVAPWSGSCSIHHPGKDLSWPPFDRSFWNPLDNTDPNALNHANTPLRMHDAAITPAPAGN